MVVKTNDRVVSKSFPIVPLFSAVGREQLRLTAQLGTTALPAQELFVTSQHNIIASQTILRHISNWHASHSDHKRPVLPRFFSSQMSSKKTPRRGAPYLEMADVLY